VAKASAYLNKALAVELKTVEAIASTLVGYSEEGHASFYGLSGI
jgi:hypothetical protein